MYSGGLGAPCRRCGLVKTSFRPSDDAHMFPYLIPANAMLSHELKTVVNILKELKVHKDIAIKCDELYKEIDEGILRNAIVNHPIFGDILAYEVNCFGSYNLMDDAGIPSLLSLPYLGYMDKNDSLYLRTRRYILSSYNPYRFSGTAGKGIGGPHAGLNRVWPMSLIIQAITSTDTCVISSLIIML
jgi:uncharacterized protein